MTEKTENSLPEIKDYLSSEGQRPLEQGEFAKFWATLTDAEKQEFKTTPLK